MFPQFFGPNCSLLLIGFKPNAYFGDQLVFLPKSATNLVPLSPCVAPCTD